MSREKMILNNRKYWHSAGLIFVAVVLQLGVCLTCQAEIGVAGSAAVELTPSALGCDVLISSNAARAMGQGDFESARDQLRDLGVSGSPYAGELQTMLGSYDRLADQMRRDQQDAYDEHHRKLLEAVANAGWQEHLREASLDYDANTPKKSKLEEKFRKETQDHWLAALAQLTYMEEVRERAGLSSRYDPNEQQIIVDKALAIGREFEQEQKWLGAFSRVYRYLMALDKQSDRYDELSRRLLRKVATTALYVSDPNADSVGWQERRQGINDRIFYHAVGVLNSYYVDYPDYKKMAGRGIENCLVLTEIPKLAQTFEQLNDGNTVAEFRENLESLAEAVEQISADQFSYGQLLVLLDGVQRVNAQTIRLPDEVIIAEFADGAFSALDNYTYVVWPGDVENFSKDMTQEFSGVGILIEKSDAGQLRVGSLLEDSPANRAGLDAGDIITAIDGKDTANITLEMAVRRITGPAGSEVVLAIDREGFEGPRDFSITRQRIIVQTVKGLCRQADGDWEYFVDPNMQIGYVNLTNFTGESPSRLRRIVEQLKGQGLRGLVLDLRYNSGGYLSGAVEIADDFIASDSAVIVSTKPNRPSQMQHVDRATIQGTVDADIPLVVLINVHSASASEIVAGCLKDHNRAVIVGTPSFGKGSVQQIQNLAPTGAQLKLTIAYYFLPSGRCVNRDPKDKTGGDYGVIPDVKVEMSAEQLERFAKVRRAAGILGQNGSGNNGGERTVYTAAEVLESDPQLQVAVLCLKAQLLAEKLGANEPIMVAK